MFEHHGHTSKLKALEDVAYVGLFSYVFGEREQARLLRTAVGLEHTIKASSYRSLLFAFAAQPWVEVLGPDGTRRTNRDGATPASVINAVGVLSPRETSIPVDEEQRDAHVVFPESGRTYASRQPADATVVLPFNSFVEVLPGAARVRELAEDYVRGFGGLEPNSSSTAGWPAS